MIGFYSLLFALIKFYLGLFVFVVSDLLILGQSKKLINVPVALHMLK